MCFLNKNDLYTPLCCWQGDTYFDSLMFFPLVYNKIMGFCWALVFWNQRFGWEILRMFYFCNNYVMRGQLFLLHNVFGTFSFPVSLFLLNLLTYNKKLLRMPREFGENQYNFCLPEIFPNSFGSERTQEDEMVGI